jgi:hypothetical protein
LAIGDGSFGMTMRGTLPGMVSRVKRVFKKAEHDGKMVVTLVNEAYTSKVIKKTKKGNIKI